MTIGILGEGAWGTTIASVLADNNHEVRLWCQDPQVAESITKTHINYRYLPQFTLNTQHIIAVTEISALFQADYIFSATPVKYLTSVLTQCIPYNTPPKKWIFLCKGIDVETGKLPTQLAQQILKIPSEHLFLLTGPSYAQEVMHKQPTGVVLAGNITGNTSDPIKNLITTSYFYCMKSTDIIGAQVAGAFKNVIALMMGILEGLSYSDNTKVLAFYKSLFCLKELIKIYGGNEETCWSLAGIGDAVLSSWGNKSRNFILGKEIGQGKKIIDSQQLLPESINTLKALHNFLSPTTVTLPLITTLCNIIFHYSKEEKLIEWIKDIKDMS